MNNYVLNQSLFRLNWLLQTKNILNLLEQELYIVGAKYFYNILKV